MEDLTQTVVDTPVDAGEVTETPATPIETPDKVVTPAVDSQEPNNGEAIKREVERREAKLREKYESETKAAIQQARDALIAEENIVWNGQQIKTESEYRQMLKEQEIRKQYEGKVDEDVMNEIVESKRFREEYNEKQKQEAVKNREQQEFQAFMEAYPDIKGDDVPAEVWAEFHAGKSLVDAYAKHENQLLKQKISALEQQKQIEQQNLDNAASSTGSVTGNGAGVPTHFTREQVEKMSREDVDKNYSAIVASMKKW